MSEVGHNSSGIAADRLWSIVCRVERLDEEKKALSADIKEIYQEAKSAGFDCSVIRKLIRERKMDAADLEEQETLLDVYRRALGPYADTPLGQAAIERVGSRA
jgi:uncharacterized protein (UPF0335 family)